MSFEVNNELTYFFSQCTIPLLLDFLVVLLHLVLVQDLEATHFQVSTVKILLVINGSGLHIHFYALYFT